MTREEKLSFIRKFSEDDVREVLYLLNYIEYIAWDNISTSERQVNTVEYFDSQPEKWRKLVNYLQRKECSDMGENYSSSEILGLDALDDDLMQDFFKRCAEYDRNFLPLANRNNSAVWDFLKQYELIRIPKTGTPFLTEEGIILGCKSGLIPAGRVHAKLEINISGEVEILHGSLLLLRKEALQKLSFLWKIGGSSADVRDRNGDEIPFFDVPQIAVIEAVTNSLIHRDFREDDRGWIEISEDKIEIVNPGACLIPLKDLLDVSSKDLRPKYSRNPRLIEVATLARINNSRGSGIRRIREALQNNRSINPQGQLGLDVWNDEQKNRFHLVVYRRRGSQRPLANESLKLQKIAASCLVKRHAAKDFVGREGELALLDAAWSGERPAALISLVGWGGVGKTALLAHWVQSRFTARGWRNADGQPEPHAYFDWTFYDQGTRSAHSQDGPHAGAASLGSFFQTALKHFGDPDPNNPENKVDRLARRIQSQRTLLILDGLEPLQYPPNHPQAGQLTDPDLSELLGRLAQLNPGLCLVSSRQPLSEFPASPTGPTREYPLEELPLQAAVALLEGAGVKGTEAELEQTANDYFCHALSLTVLGRYLALNGGDIRRRDVIQLETASAERNQRITRNAWHVLEAYEQWLASPEGNPADAQALRLAGLFDRPASPGCLDALRQAPSIPGLTDALVPLSDGAWNAVLMRLHEAHLIQLRLPPDDPTSWAPRPEPRQVPLDAHPLIREYFAKRLREISTEAFLAAHSRLFDHLCQTTEHRPDTLEGLLPLYQAVRHGCLAERQQEALDEVYVDRIQRGTGNDGSYSRRKLGAIRADLGAVAAFFVEPWVRLSPNLSEAAQGWLHSEAAFSLRALGRLSEAREPMRAGLDMAVKNQDWKHAAARADNLSELEVMLGLLDQAATSARQAIVYADQMSDGSEAALQRLSKRNTVAEAMHQRGTPADRAEALALLQQAETRQRETQPTFDSLHSLEGFRYGERIQAPAERAVWRWVLGAQATGDPVATLAQGLEPAGLQEVPRLRPPASQALEEIGHRAAKTLAWSKKQGFLLGSALDHLTLARMALYCNLLAPQGPSPIDRAHLSAALDGLRQAGDLTYLPKALLTAALHHHALDHDPDAARRCLDEAQRIAERGPMPLVLADVHLHRARLFRDKAELEKARALIQKHGYGRRREELADADEAARFW